MSSVHSGAISKQQLLGGYCHGNIVVCVRESVWGGGGIQKTFMALSDSLAVVGAEKKGRAKQMN